MAKTRADFLTIRQYIPKNVARSANYMAAPRPMTREGFRIASRSKPAACRPPAGIHAEGAAKAAYNEGSHQAEGLARSPAEGGADIGADEDEEFQASTKEQKTHPLLMA